MATERNLPASNSKDAYSFNNSMIAMIIRSRTVNKNQLERQSKNECIGKKIVMKKKNMSRNFTKNYNYLLTPKVQTNNFQLF